MSDGRTHRASQTQPDQVTEERMEQIRSDIRTFTFLTTDRIPDLVVIEGGAFSRGTQSKAAEDLSGLRYIVRCWLWKNHIPFAMVTPTGLKAYTTGYGSATKRMMAEAVRDRHGVDLSHVLVKDGRYDMADGLALAAMGYAHLGHQLPTVGPPGPLKSLLAVDWPQLVRDET
jgi:Holliday junction resolvasome RuvABC endonuclease subunit